MVHSVECEILLFDLAQDVSLHQWRPISSIGGLDKIFTKLLPNISQLKLTRLIHPIQYKSLKVGLLPMLSHNGNRIIWGYTLQHVKECYLIYHKMLHIVLNVEIFIDYIGHINHEVIIVQLYIFKHLSFHFVTRCKCYLETKGDMQEDWVE